MYKLGFIGSGKMGAAIARCVVSAKVLEAKKIACCSHDGKDAQALSEECGVCAVSGAQDIVENSDTIILAFKPQQLEELARDIGDQVSGKSIVSLLAGVTLEKLGQYFPGARLITRTMPSLTVSGGYGTLAYVHNKEASTEDSALLMGIFESLGKVYALDEEQFDSYTAVCGCGPGFVFEIARGMEAAAEELGLEKEMVLETVLGSAQLLRDSDLSAAELRNSVASKGGATAAGLEVLESKNLPQILKSAILASETKCKELGKTDEN